MHEDFNPYKATKEYMAHMLNQAGHYVESGSDEDSLSLSLTNMGLSCAYAEISSEEIKWFWDEAADYIKEDIMEYDHSHNREMLA